MTGPQMQILALDECQDTYIDVEGAPRSAKSWGVGFWIRKLAYQYPGIQIFYCRYKDEALIQLRDVWQKVDAYFPPAFRPRWNTTDACYEFVTGSRCFLSSLRVTEQLTSDAAHGKYKGKTLAVVIIEEAQEVPRVNYIGLKERLSQSRTPDGRPYKYPLKLVLVHNAIDEDHWIAQEFPLDGDICTRQGHRHIRADLYSNALNLGPDVMQIYEDAHPPGATTRATTIEGRRGVTMIGQPVYGFVFKRATHATVAVPFSRYYPLLEGWDFGEEKPAVVWLQYLRHIAALRIVGAVKGSDLFLEQFAPRVLEIRRRLFPHATEIRSWCDPTGAVGNGGLEYTPVKLLIELGVPVRPAKDAASSRDGNDAEVRYKAIQVLAGHMLRTAVDGSPAFLTQPTCIELVRERGQLIERESRLLTAAFESGYIWDTAAPSEARPNIRKPKKGTRFDDLMNAAEYVVIGEKIPLAATVSQIANAAASYQHAPQRAAIQAEIQARVALRAAQKDDHPIDSRMAVASRGRYARVPY